MDPEIPELGPGPEPADPAVRGTDHAVFIEKRRGRSSCTVNPAAPTLFRRHLQYCQKIPTLFQRPGVGRAHEKRHICKCLISHAKKSLRAYKQKNSGYTKIRRKIRQQKIPKTDSKFLHIELLSREAWTSKDTRFLTPSETGLTGQSHDIFLTICFFYTYSSMLRLSFNPSKKAQKFPSPY